MCLFLSECFLVRKFQVGILHDHSSQLNKFVAFSHHTIPLMNAIWKVKNTISLLPQLLNIARLVNNFNYLGDHAI